MLITSVINQISVDEVTAQILEELVFIYEKLPKSYVPAIKHYERAIVETLFCSRGLNQTYQVFSKFEVEKFDPATFPFNLRKVGLNKWLIVVPPIDGLDDFCTPIVLHEQDVRRMFAKVFCDPSMTGYNITSR